jgi:hypothetical protein
MSVVSSNVFHGIFGCEAGQRMIVIGQSMSSRGFGSLYEKYGKTKDYKERLSSVNTWKREVFAEEARMAKEEMPDAEETLGECFSMFVNDKFRFSSKKTSTCAPSLEEFLEQYLKSFSTMDAVKSGVYFEREYDLTFLKTVVSDAIRSTFHIMCNSNSLHKVELASEVSAYPEKEDVISPDDSASNIGRSVVGHEVASPLQMETVEENNTEPQTEDDHLDNNDTETIIQREETNICAQMEDLKIQQEILEKQRRLVDMRRDRLSKGKIVTSESSVALGVKKLLSPKKRRT